MSELKLSELMKQELLLMFIYIPCLYAYLCDSESLTIDETGAITYVCKIWYFNVITASLVSVYLIMPILFLITSKSIIYGSWLISYHSATI